MSKLMEHWKSIAQDTTERASKVQCDLFEYLLGLEYIISVLREAKVDTLSRMHAEQKGGGVNETRSNSSPA
jgi:hypothetical protein